MKHFKSFSKLFIWILFGFILSVSFAQMQGVSPIVGTWQTSIELGQGIAPATGIFQVQADGRYREEMYIQGQLAAFWEGQYSLAPDGTLTQQESNKSPQICMQGQCMANDGPSMTISRVSVQGPNAFMVSIQDPSNGQMFNITWQRMNAQSTNQSTPSGSQPMTQANTSQNPLIGSWQYNERTQQGHTVTTILSYGPDGRFSIQRILNGRSLMSSYGGTYQLDANGNLIENTTEKSPQFCYLQCQPNPVQLGSSGPMQIGFANADTLIYSGLGFQRANMGGMPASTGTQMPLATMPGGMPNTGTFESTYPMPSMDNGDFVNGVIWGQSDFQDPNGSGTFMLPDSPDPDMTYYAPSGNPLSYNDVTGGWIETDPYGFETEVNPSGE